MVMKSALSKLTRRRNSEAVIQFTFCDYLNISVCPGTETPRSFIITAYNPIARSVNAIIRVPVSTKDVKVFSIDGKPVPFGTQPVTKVTKIVRGKLGNAPYELVFSAIGIPPLGSTVYQVNVTLGEENPAGDIQRNSDVRGLEGNNVDHVIENEHLRLTFSNKTGRLVEIENLKSRIKQSVDQQFLWYNSSVGNNVSDQASNAYNFRPNSSTPFNMSVENYAKITIFKNDVVQEVHQMFSPWISQVVRLYSNKQFAEFEYTVGPIEMSSELGKEVISRFDSSLKTNGVFYSDANGREMQRRKRDYRPTWSYKGKDSMAGPSPW
jgi:lysosomal alpha-mannosidase